LENDLIPEPSSEVSAREILHSLPDAVITTDRQMRINYFNLAASKLTGFRPREALGMFCKDVLKSDMCETECLIKKALDLNQNIFSFETVITTADGGKLPILTNASLLTTLSGKVVGYMQVFRDITSIKKITSDLRTSRRELIEKNAALARALKELKSTQEQLLHAQKMESMGILAGGIAHDFNNLLSGILGYASLLKMKIDSGNPLYKYVDTIEKSAVKSSELTKKLLAFSRTVKYRLEVIDINQVIEEFLSIIEKTISKRINIHKSLASDLWAIEAEPSQIEQAFLNLFINACDAMPEGGKLSIITENYILNDEDEEHINFIKAEKGKYIKVSIADTGEGIPAEILNKIFDPFFSTKDKHKGSGLGLSVVYGVVKDHGGYINIKSKPGEGTIFEIIFPISSKPLQKTIFGEKQEVVGGSETILIVDDDKVSRNLGEEILSDKGYKIVLAGTGFKAIEIYRKQKDDIALVILDMIMPGIDGRETCKRLKQINPSLKILISSGFSDETKKDNEFRSWIQGFIQKPYNINELSKKVRRILDSKE
jgi:two-component system cell cycle sensor histidine kinase/response regulator CckA